VKRPARRHESDRVACLDVYSDQRATTTWPPPDLELSDLLQRNARACLFPSALVDENAVGPKNVRRPRTPASIDDVPTGNQPRRISSR
jgi:hypothetical protein